MTSYDYDFIAIGGGSAGATAATNAVALGAKKVLLIEKEHIGGTCVNVGCLPTKSIIHSANLITNSIKANEFILQKQEPSTDWQAIKREKEKHVLVSRSAGTNSLKRSGVEVKQGQAQIEDAHTIGIGNEKITAKYILIGFGSKIFIPPIEGLSQTPHLTSTTALELDKLPKSILIIGGSYIGLEFAHFFNAVGVETTVIEAVDRIARVEDNSISDYLTESLIKQGVNILTSTKVNSVAGDDNEVTIEAQKEQESLTIKAEKVLVATGRIPNLDFGLKEIGIDYDKKGIKVNQYLQTNIENIYAAGDCLPTLQLEHVATYEGWLASQNIFSAKKISADYQVVPHVMFSSPEVASVGQTEEEASKVTDVVTSNFKYSSITAAQINEEREGFIKLIGDSKSRQLLGAHIIGADAGNLIHLAAIMMQAKVKIDELNDSISAFPTLAQGFYYAADSLVENINFSKIAA